MELHILGSSSSGNCYILQAENNSSLIIEGGVKISEVKKALNFDISQVEGVIITHEHTDHGKYAKEFIKAGINVYATKGTINALKIEKERYSKRVAYGDETRIGDFKIIPFMIHHDAAEPCGFLIHHPECGVVLFATDTHYLPNRFKGLNNIIVEANYDKVITSYRLTKGSLNASVYNRILTSHMEINTTLEVLKSNDLSNVTNIVLIHLSDGNSNEKEFVKAVSELTGKLVYAANKGMIINFNKGL